MNAENTCCENVSTGVAEVERTNRGCYSPLVDIIENEKEFLLVMDVPGARAEDIDVDYERGRLAIHAKVTPRRADDERFVVREYGVGDFRRAFRIGEGVDAENIDATVRDGVLTVRLAKTSAVLPRKVTVKTGDGERAVS